VSEPAGLTARPSTDNTQVELARRRLVVI